MSNWVSVDDRLPVTDIKCLVATKCGEQWTGHYNAPITPDAWYLHGWASLGGWHPFEVTHWMPLPQLPNLEIKK